MFAIMSNQAGLRQKVCELRGGGWLGRRYLRLWKAYVRDGADIMWLLVGNLVVGGGAGL